MTLRTHGATSEVEAALWLSRPSAGLGRVMNLPVSCQHQRALPVPRHTALAVTARAGPPSRQRCLLPAAAAGLGHSGLLRMTSARMPGIRAWRQRDRARPWTIRIIIRIITPRRVYLQPRCSEHSSSGLTARTIRQSLSDACASGAANGRRSVGLRARGFACHAALGFGRPALACGRAEHVANQPPSAADLLAAKQPGACNRARTILCKTPLQRRNN